MNFFKGELKNFDLYGMNKVIIEHAIPKLCYNGIIENLDEDNKKDIQELLKYSGQLYYLFGNRQGKYLSCVNGKKYFINDEKMENKDGIDMQDAYINPYEDINLGYLITYNNENIEIEPAIEGQASWCRRCEVLDDCGDLNNEMKEFIQNYIL